jgi:hypothetical protein
MNHPAGFWFLVSSFKDEPPCLVDYEFRGAQSPLGASLRVSVSVRSVNDALQTAPTDASHNRFVGRVHRAR